MRQYCSGGSRTWSSIQPLFGVCSSGWFRKKANRPPGSRTRATSAMASSTVADVLEHEAGDDARRTTPSRNGQAGGARPGVGRSPARCARDHAPAPTSGRRRRTVARAERGASRATWPSPHPTSSTRGAPARHSAASGRICSSYSGSAPSVNPSCHQSACRSQRSSPGRPRRRGRCRACHQHGRASPYPRLPWRDAMRGHGSWPRSSSSPSRSCSSET